MEAVRDTKRATGSLLTRLSNQSKGSDPSVPFTQIQSHIVCGSLKVKYRQSLCSMAVGSEGILIKLDMGFSWQHAASFPKESHDIGRCTRRLNRHAIIAIYITYSSQLTVGRRT